MFDLLWEFLGSIGVCVFIGFLWLYAGWFVCCCKLFCVYLLACGLFGVYNDGWLSGWRCLCGAFVMIFVFVVYYDWCWLRLMALGDGFCMI